jgi:hypothetical protein
MRSTARTPRWVECARGYRARSSGVAHHDGTCDAMYPGSSDERDGRCLLAEGHPGMHLYRGHGPGKHPTRLQTYQAVRVEKKRVALRTARRERERRRS